MREIVKNIIAVSVFVVLVALAVVVILSGF